jgi:ATP-dependent phosphofructokinase / diphosphate-dependent phosphofructokinase
MRIGLLTAGGDCPGLNAVIRGVVARARQHGADVVGILEGWDGLMEGRFRPLDRDAVRGILQRGGTILGTSRRDPYVHGDGAASVRGAIEGEGLDGLIVVGGDGTLRSALGLWEEGVPLVGVPKTIDNDIPGTDVTFGFDTAVQIATEAIDRITTTAESHDRVMVVEVMGRTCGWIATYAGVAAGADAILVPEEPYELSELAELLRARVAGGRRYSVVVVAEGVAPPPGAQIVAPLDAFGFERLGGVSAVIAAELERLTGFEARVTVLGHVQRGGTPSAAARVLGSRLGVAAADLAVSGAFGRMVVLRGTEIVDVPLDVVRAEPRSVPTAMIDVARTLSAP